MDQTKTLAPARSGSSDPAEPSSATRAVLRVAEGPDQGLVVELAEGTAVVGSEEGCAVQLRDPTVSRRHLSIEVGRAEAVVRDLDSKNGSFFGGARLHELRLTDRALLRLGESAIELRIGGGRTGADGSRRFGGAVGRAPAMLRLFDLLERVSASDATILLQGETGTGKEVLARAVHEASPRRSGPFVTVDCSALSATLADSELFGHLRGAFTGAAADRKGALLQANGGTLFLDEIGELTPAVQVKLLRVLQDGVLDRLGGTAPVQIDVRLVAATNKDLAAEVRAGRFREDLFFRLHVVAVRLPPLRERREDILPLASVFLRRFAAATGRPISGLTAAARARLEAAAWPGNVRELMHAVERAVILARGDVLDAEDLPEALGADPGRSLAGPGGPAALSVPLGTTLDEVERQVIRETLRQTRGDKTLAAQLLGIAPRTIYRKLDRDEAGRLVAAPGADDEDDGAPSP